MNIHDILTDILAPAVQTGIVASIAFKLVKSNATMKTVFLAASLFSTLARAFTMFGEIVVEGDKFRYERNLDKLFISRWLPIFLANVITFSIFWHLPTTAAIGVTVVHIGWDVFKEVAQRTDGETIATGMKNFFNSIANS